MSTIAWGKDSGADIVLPWYGNASLVGCRIAGAGQTDDDVLLDYNEFTPDANTVALYHLDEMDLSQPIIDATGTLNLDVIQDSALPIESREGWLYNALFKDRASVSASSSRLQAETCPDVYLPRSTGTAEAWIKPFGSGGDSGWVGTIWGINPRGPSPMIQFAWGYWSYRNRVALKVTDPSGTVWRDWADTTLTPEEWHHLAVCWDGQTVTFWHDGILVGTKTAAYPLFDGWNWGVRRVRMFTGVDTHGDEQYRGYIDEVRYSSIVRYLSDFSPHRYEAGSVVAQYDLPAAQRLTSISWDGTLGASYGLLTKLEVYTASGWQTVAEDANGLTSPITGLNHTVAGPDLVRATLVPKADTLQSETPTLDWLQVSLEPLVKYKLPYNSDDLVLRKLVSSGSIKKLAGSSTRASYLKGEM